MGAPCLPASPDSPSKAKKSSPSPSLPAAAKKLPALRSTAVPCLPAPSSASVSAAFSACASLIMSFSTRTRAWASLSAAFTTDTYTSPAGKFTT